MTLSTDRTIRLAAISLMVVACAACGNGDPSQVEHGSTASYSLRSAGRRRNTRLGPGDRIRSTTRLTTCGSTSTARPTFSSTTASYGWIPRSIKTTRSRVRWCWRSIRWAGPRRRLAFSPPNAPGTTGRSRSERRRTWAPTSSASGRQSSMSSSRALMKDQKSSGC